MNFGFVRNDSGAINIRRCEVNRKEQQMKYAILTVSIAAGDILLKKHIKTLDYLLCEDIWDYIN